MPAKKTSVRAAGVPNGSKSKTPVKKPPVKFNETQKLIGRLEAHLQARFLTYWNSHNGSVCSNDVVAFYEILQYLGPVDELFLFIKSNGGSVLPTLRIVNLLRQHVKKLTALVPLECCSAATMIALGADSIRMGPTAFLTPVDTSLTHDLSPIDRDNDRVSVSLDELHRVIRLWKEEKGDNGENPYKSIYQYIHPLVLGAVDRMSSLSIKLCQEILAYHIEEDAERRRISELLNYDYPSHSYPILLREAQRIGLKAESLDTASNTMLLDLNEIYSEMGQRATTDYDQFNQHNNEIINILEARGIQIFFQNDKDWHYRAEERRWVALNDLSSWQRLERKGGKLVQSKLHVR